MSNISFKFVLLNVMYDFIVYTNEIIFIIDHV